MTEEEDLELVEEIEFVEEEEDDVKYEKLVLSDDSDGDDDESLEILVRNAKSHTSAGKTGPTESVVEDASNDLIENSDSYVRAFLTQMRMHETLNVFQAEWYRLEATSSLDRSKIGKVPLMYLDYYYLDQKLRKLDSEVKRMKDTATRVQKTWARLKIDRDGYKLAHMRVGHEKHATLESIRGLLHQTKQKMPTLDDYSAKIESADKDRMLLELEVQRLRQLHDRLIASQPKPEAAETKPKVAPVQSEKVTVTIKSILQPNPALNPYEQASKPNLEQLTHRVIHKAHETPIACVATHPKRKVYATAGDDAVWHLWNAENSELLISGRGHSAWITSCAFHPRGAHLATGSGDGTARVWDFLSSKCALVLKGHLDVVWSVDFHSGGRVLATSGSDSTIRLYDLQGGQELSILRGHDRDINCVRWCQFSNTMVTAGADHLVGLWDAREGAMVNRGIGHSGAIFSVAPSLNGSSFASVDTTGEIKMWDIREMRPIFETSYASPLHSCGTDVTGTYLFVASDDGKAQVFMRDDAKTSWTLSTFDQACETIAVNADGDMVVCGAGDGNVAVCTNQ
jgi:hypothetical protein